MKILILGSSALAASIAEELCDAGHDITIIDNRLDAIKKIDMELDVRGIIGQPTHPEVLAKGECGDSDAIIAILDHDESNMVACQIAHSLFQVPIKIARIRTQNYLLDGQLFGDDQLPIDVFINPEKEIAKRVSQIINHPGAKEIQCHNHAAFVMIEVPAESSWVGQSVKDIQAYWECVLIAQFHEKTLNYFENEQIIQPHMHIMLACDVSRTNDLIRDLGIKQDKIDDIVIAGAGHNAKNLIKQLNDHFDITIIEKTHANCIRFAKEFPDIKVLHADIKDHVVWEQESLSKNDFFCALTDDDASNLLSALMAKQMSCPKTLCLFKEPDYVSLLLPYVDFALSSRSATINSILTALYQSKKINKVMSLAYGQLLAVSVEVTEDHPAIGQTRNEFKPPSRIHCIGITRQETFISNPEQTIMAGDLLVLITHHRNAIHNL